MEGEETGVYGHDRFRAGPQRIVGKQTEIRRTVDDREVVLRSEFGEVIGEDSLAPGDASQTLWDLAQANIGWGHVQVFACRTGDVAKADRLIAGLRHEGEVLSLLDNETGMHSCLEPKTQASPVSAGGKRRHPRAHENTGIGADKPEAR